MKIITLEGLKEFWKGFKESLSKVAFSGDYNDLTNKPPVSSIPDSIKNPCAFQANGKTYDGAAAVNMGTVGIAYGGTGATTAAAARTNLGLGEAAAQGIANNLSTTAAGYALDARQGTALKQNIDELNGSLQNMNTAISDTGLVQTERGDVNIPSGGVETYVTSVNLYPGTYCIFGQLTYPSNENGYRHISIYIGNHNLASDTRNAVKGGNSNISIAAIHTVDALSQAKLMGMQTSGAALNAIGLIVTVRIK